MLSGLNSAGMQSPYGSDATKPRYWRSMVNKNYITEPIFLRYFVDDVDSVSRADDADFLRESEIGCELYCNNGFGDSDYQTLAAAIETQLALLGFNVMWENESTDTSLDEDNPISVKRFTVTKTKL